MASIERSPGKEDNRSIWNSRFFKGGAATAILGAGLGIGFLVRIGVVAVVGGAAWTQAFGKSKNK